MEEKYSPAPLGTVLKELFFSLSVLALIVYFAVPKLTSLANRSKQEEAILNLKSIYKLEKKFFSEYGTYTNSLQALNWKPVYLQNYIVGFKNQVLIPEKVEGYYGSYLGVFTSNSEFFSEYQNGKKFLEIQFLPSSGLGQNPAIGFSLSDVCKEVCLGFVAAAAGNLDGEDTIDQWQINQEGMLYNLENDVSR